MSPPAHAHAPDPFGDAAFRPSPERAQAYIAQHGVLILDDNLSQLEAVASVCTDFLEIPAHQVVLVHARPGLPLASIINETEAALRRHMQLTGASFAGVITDYNLSGGMTSLEVWRAIDASFKAPDAHECWRRTGRVLMSASPREPAIVAAEESNLIDRYIAKPFQLSTFQDALVASVARRLSQ